MAEGTRFKNLEDQVKKQELKLQEALSSIQQFKQEFQQPFQNEMEVNNQKMELIIRGVKEELSALVKMMSKEKAAEMCESSHIDKTPILPASPL